MKALILDAPTNMRVGESSKPVAGPSEVVVQVAAAGVCAGDLLIYRGNNPYASYPIIAGHEMAGVISDIAQDVTGFKLAERVVIEPFISCGKCYPCRVGKNNCCANLHIIGVHSPGGFAEYVKAPAKNIHKVPDGLPLEYASFAEPVAIAVQACRRGEVGNEYVLILGCGPIGLALIEVAKARGARVVATDVLEDRLVMAQALGAETIVSDDKLLAAVLEQTKGEGAPVVIEATGNLKVMEATVDLVASGGRIVIVGLGKKGQSVSFPALDFTRKEMTLLGSRTSVNCFPEALELLASGKIHYPKVATNFSMWEAPELFKKLSDNPAMLHKALLRTEAA
jgi:L-gulonate 5-dehydrogenase